MTEIPDRTESVFSAAVALSDNDERTALLDELCANDTSLRGRVEALLRAHEQANHLLDRPVADLLSQSEKLKDDLQPTSAAFGVTDTSATSDYRLELGAGSMIAGRYTLRKKIGEGGMGEVWAAKQSEPVKRKVAIKLIKLGMDSRSVVTRFEQERQALAMMDHPNIARVLDGGLTSAGQPFFVMELVNGLPLTKFCDEAKLTVKQRLELFLPICQAVQHAHQKGIVHRDLKPANILVTMIDGNPVPKVIDFGVAKATGGKLTEETMSTQFGAVVGTLEYMSPEQAGFSGEDIDTRADIFSLGVILYEILTGLRPIDGQRLRHAAVTEMIRIIREEEPSKPSTRLSTNESLPSMAAVRQIEPKKLTAILRGELDWVVMKCLEKSRNRRYETANALSRDVQRYLANEPVDARPPSAGYRTRKFLRRHRGPVVAASLLILAMVAGIVGTGIGLIRARDAQELAVAAQLAEAERADGEQRAKLAAQEATLQAQEATLHAQKRLSQIETANDILGSIFDSINPYDDENPNQPLREILIEKLDQAVEQLDGEAIGDPLVVASMQSKLARALFGLGEPAKARALCEKVIKTQKGLLGPDDPTTLTSMNNLAAILQNQGQLKEAFELQTHVLDRQTATLGADNPETMLSLANVAEAYHQSGRPDLAVPMLEKVLQYRKSQFPENHPEILTVMNDLAAAYEAIGKLQLALPLFEHSLEQFELQLGESHLQTLRAMNNLGFAYNQDGKPELAVPILERSMNLARRSLGNDHPATLNAMHNLASAYQRLKQPEKALPLFEKSLELTRAKHGEEHPHTLSSMNGLAACYQRSGKPDLALPIFEELVVLAEKVHGSDHRITVSCKANLGVVYESVGENEKALDQFEQVIRDPAYASPRLRRRVLQLCVQTKNAERAAEVGADLVADARETCLNGSPELADELFEIGSALMQAEAFAASEPFLRESLSIREITQPDDWSTFATQSILGGVLLDREKYAGAEPKLLSGYEGMKKREADIPVQKATHISDALKRLVRFYEATDDPKKADQWNAKLNAIDQPVAPTNPSPDQK